MNQIEKIQMEFTKQAKTFEDYQKIFSKEEFNRWAIDQMGLTGTEEVLEVAAGTCALGRMVSPYVDRITELDATKAMLEVGEQEAIKEGLHNLTFINALAEKLPFHAQTFDLVMSRLAFHHFENVHLVFSEMNRVLKKSGKLVIIDMEAREENLRTRADELETLRDPSHVKCLSRAEFYELASQHHMKVTVCEMIPIPVSLTAWMELTKVKMDVRTELIHAMEEDIAGKKKTGFDPYKKDRDIYFNHKWMLIIAENAE